MNVPFSFLRKKKEKKKYAYKYIIFFFKSQNLFVCFMIKTYTYLLWVHYVQVLPYSWFREQLNSCSIQTSLTMTTFEKWERKVLDQDWRGILFLVWASWLLNQQYLQVPKKETNRERNCSVTLKNPGRLGFECCRKAAPSHIVESGGCLSLALHKNSGCYFQCYVGQFCDKKGRNLGIFPSLQVTSLMFCFIGNLFLIHRKVES